MFTLSNTKTWSIILWSLCRTWGLTNLVKSNIIFPSLFSMTSTLFFVSTYSSIRLSISDLPPEWVISLACSELESLYWPFTAFEALSRIVHRVEFLLCVPKGFKLWNPQRSLGAQLFAHMGHIYVRPWCNLSSKRESREPRSCVEALFASAAFNAGPFYWHRLANFYHSSFDGVQSFTCCSSGEKIPRNKSDIVLLSMSSHSFIVSAFSLFSPTLILSSEFSAYCYC